MAWIIAIVFIITKPENEWDFSPVTFWQIRHLSWKIELSLTSKKYSTKTSLKGWIIQQQPGHYLPAIKQKNCWKRLVHDSIQKKIVVTPTWNTCRYFRHWMKYSFFNWIIRRTWIGRKHQRAVLKSMIKTQIKLIKRINYKLAPLQSKNPRQNNFMRSFQLLKNCGKKRKQDIS